MALTLTSTAFANGASIPALYTCEGEDCSPPLAWTGVPAGTKSLALIVSDPDAPGPGGRSMTWVHWVLYNMPSTTKGLPEGASRGGLPRGTLEGRNDWNRTGYGGPCPPVGRHRYIHELFAIDAVFADLRHPTKAALETAMKGHVLAHARLLGTYQKSG